MQQTIIISANGLLFAQLCTTLANAGIVTQGAFESETKRFHMLANGFIDHVNRVINLSKLVHRRSEFIVTPYVGPNENF